MSERETHPEALHNYQNAILPEEKIRYALTDPDKRRPFEALGFSMKAENWEELRNEITKRLPVHRPVSSRRPGGVTFTTWT